MITKIRYLVLFILLSSIAINSLYYNINKIALTFSCVGLFLLLLIFFKKKLSNLS